MSHGETDDESHTTVEEGDANTVRTSWEESLPSHSVVEVVAATSGTAPSDLRPLFEVVDPDALDQLFQSETGGSPPSNAVRVSLRYEGCRVTVYPDGRTVASLLDGDSTGG